MGKRKRKVMFPCRSAYLKWARHFVLSPLGPFLDPFCERQYLADRTQVCVAPSRLRRTGSMKYPRLWHFVGSVSALLLLLPLGAQAQNGKKEWSLKPVTTERLLKGTNETSSWLMYGGNYENWRFSPLKDVNRKNVKNLQVAWI